MPTPWEFVDHRMDGGKDNSAERSQGNQGTAGECGQAGPIAPTGPDVSPDSYPNIFGYAYDSNNPEFSRDKNWEPQAMAEEASGSAFADLQHFLNNSPYTAGSRVCHELKETWESPHDAAPGSGDGKTGPAD